MSQTKVILTALIVVTTAIFTGCGQESKPVETKSISPAVSAPVADKTEPEETLPVPTGDIDDIVDAAIEDARSEEAQGLQDEADALEAIDDSRETDDFGQSYDESEF